MDVYLFLVQVTAKDHQDQDLEAGSEAELQFFVPAENFDQAFSALDELVEKEHFTRNDVVLSERFSASETRENVNNDSLYSQLQRVFGERRPSRGILFYSDESARMKLPPGRLPS